MGYKGVLSSLFLSGFFGVLISELKDNIQLYKECQAPIQDFLLSAYTLFLGLSIISLIVEIFEYHITEKVKKSAALVFFVVLSPYCVYFTAQGLFRHIQNQTETPDCASANIESWKIWSVIGVLGIYSIVYITIAGVIYISLCKRLLAGLGRSQGDSCDNHDGFTIEEIEKLPKKIYDQSISDSLGAENTMCSICYEDYQFEENVTPFTKCEHLYHSHCIGKWLEKSSLCPMCRTNARTYQVKV